MTEKVIKFSVLTVSDSAFKDFLLDKSGYELVNLLESSTKFPAVEVVNRSIVPDEKDSIVGYLRAYVTQVFFLRNFTFKKIGTSLPNFYL